MLPPPSPLLWLLLLQNLPVTTNSCRFYRFVSKIGSLLLDSKKLANCTIQRAFFAESGATFCCLAVNMKCLIQFSSLLAVLPTYTLFILFMGNYIGCWKIFNDETTKHTPIPNVNVFLMFWLTKMYIKS